MEQDFNFPTGQACIACAPAEQEQDLQRHLPGQLLPLLREKDAPLGHVGQLQPALRFSHPSANGVAKGAIACSNFNDLAALMTSWWKNAIHGQTHKETVATQTAELITQSGVIHATFCVTGFSYALAKLLQHHIYR